MAINVAIEIFHGVQDLGPMMIEHVKSLRELELAVHEHANLAHGRYNFIYRGVNGYIRVADFHNFSDFGDNLCTVNVKDIGFREIVEFR